MTIKKETQHNVMWLFWPCIQETQYCVPVQCIQETDYCSIRESRRVRSMFQFCIVVLKLCVVARVNLHLTYHSRIVYCPNTNQSTTRHGFTFVLDRPHSISTPCQLSRLPGHCPPARPPHPLAPLKPPPNSAFRINESCGACMFA